MPITSAKENPCSTSPPKRYRAKTVRNVNPAVRMVRLSVWLILRLTISASRSRRSSLMFSRIRSKTTMVSLFEYPTSVRIAAITVSEIGLLLSENTPTVISVS